MKKSKEEKMKMIERATSQFTELDEIDKAYISGYVSGKAEERQKWAGEQKEHQPVML